ncbi:MAG: SMC-Scp complex subunit ScpB [Acutalibacteraceae bacterium]|nr:SMC-Scp complex subunit ScpB [Acutalibacteraceae bacterium]
MMNKDILPTLEAVLFAVGEPIEITKLSQALGIEIVVLGEALEILKEKYEDESSGLCLLRLDDKYQLCTKKQYADSIRNVIEVKKNAPLSQAAFEVLAIVAYNQPVTKSFIEQIRGVDCSAVISNLCQKSLIEEKGRLELPGRPLIYGTTPEFLRCFCISSLDELPELPKNEEKSENTETDLEITVDENKNLE